MKKEKTMNTNFAVAFLISIAVGMAVSVSAAQPEITNEVVVIIDGSGSYRSRQAEAVDRTLSLLEELAARKTKRWETDSDKVTLISLDALPDVLWTGTTAELKALDRGSWTKRFESRSDYAGCTDVTAAFRLATRQLRGDSKHVDKYILSFSDLIHEPPTTTLRKCAPTPRPSPPSADFPWDELEDVSVVTMWVPASQMLPWRRAVEERGLDTFALHSDSESSAVVIVAPQKRVHVMTDEERAGARKQVTDSARKWGKRLAMMIGALVTLIVGLAITAALARRRRRRHQPAKPSRGNERRLTTTAGSPSLRADSRPRN